MKLNKKKILYFWEKQIKRDIYAYSNLGYFTLLWITFYIGFKEVRERRNGKEGQERRRKREEERRRLEEQREQVDSSGKTSNSMTSSTEVGAVGHRIVHFIDVQEMNSKSGLLYQTEESLKLNFVEIIL